MGLGDRTNEQKEERGGQLTNTPNGVKVDNLRTLQHIYIYIYIYVGGTFRYTVAIWASGKITENECEMDFTDVKCFIS